MIAAGSPAESGLASTSEDTPSTTRLRIIPIRPASSIGLRPTRSTSRIASTVMAMFSVPIARLA
jgi:hypothetical protein